MPDECPVGKEPEGQAGFCGWCIAGTKHGHAMADAGNWCGRFIFVALQPLLRKPLDESTSLYSEKVDDSRSRFVRHGLGLYITWEIVLAHGGTIEATSDAERTTFRVRMPRMPPWLGRHRTTIVGPVLMIPPSLETARKVGGAGTPCATQGGIDPSGLVWKLRHDRTL